MGQKINPHALRVGVLKDWNSKWYDEDYNEYYFEVVDTNATLKIGIIKDWSSISERQQSIKVRARQFIRNVLQRSNMRLVLLRKLLK